MVLGFFEVGLLIITGIDSRENTECTKLLNWVLQGHQGIEIESNEYLDTNLSDMIFLIKPSGTSIYCDRAGWSAIKNQVILIPNLSVYVPTSEDDENKVNGIFDSRMKAKCSK